MHSVLAQACFLPDRRRSRLRPAWIATGLSAVFVLLGLPAVAAETPEGVTPELRAQALGALRQTLHAEALPRTVDEKTRKEARWIRVHAAEYLLALDYPEGVAETFQKELASHGGEPEYRVGIWRVLYRAAIAEENRQEWLDKVRDVFFDRGSPDRPHAAETLAKLRYVPRNRDEESLFEAETDNPNTTVAISAAWVLANAGKPAGVRRLLEWLGSDDATCRAYAAYALRKLPSLSEEGRRLLQAAFEREPAASPARAQLACAAAVHAAGPEAGQAALDEVRRCAVGEVERDRYQACETLGSLATTDDLPRLVGLIRDDPSADVRATAAYAVLRLDRRGVHGLVWPDWAVIGVYLVAMLGIGWYYSRRTKTTEDYLLGGRQMKPLGLGLSLFATLLSTISYLSWPGEVIQNGPMMLGMIAAYPLIYYVVGGFMIPFIMRLRVTSAYEILEVRLGLGARMVGSSLFLLMRLLWMAVIIYATTHEVLVPLMGLGTWTTPYVCAVLAVVTVIYTSMGGLRAVVVTDVTQTVILFAGAIAALVLVTIRMGGVGSWFPTEWPAQWPEPTWGFSSTARVTFLGAVLANFTWWVCTSGSDQMAIQRYLATRDAKTAKKVLGISCWANTLVMIVLAAVGLALFAYFRANPQLIADGKTLLRDADQVFPRFIACGLPPGISGLVVAGLLAAAMSSLSAGVNSSCSVITVDFLDRFHRNPTSEHQHVRLAKYISAFVGLAIVVLSSGVGVVHGNLLEIAYKVVNLLTAPLFGLFFMAMFVRWATAPGALVGVVFGTATVALVNYWKELTGTPGISFLWAMPLGLLVQVGIGSLVSLLPWGTRRPLLE